MEGVTTPQPKLGGLQRLGRAFINSSRGFTAAFRDETAFRQEVLLAIVVIPLGVWLGDTGIERALLVGSMLLILIVELLNTGVEKAIDRIGPERHPLSGMAKDVGSTAVLLSFVLAGVVWGCILLD